MSIIAQRYAKALLLQAKLDKVERNIYLDIKYLTILFKNNPELNIILYQNKISASNKKSIILKLYQNKNSPLTLKFLNLLEKKKRFSILLEICKSFLKEFNIHKHLEIVYLITTTSISIETIEKLKFKMKNILNCDKIKIIKKIDTSLKGGYILRYKDMQIDNTIKTKFQKLRLGLLSNL